MQNPRPCAVRLAGKFLSLILFLSVTWSASAELNVPVVLQSTNIYSLIRTDGTQLAGANLGSAVNVTSNGVSFLHAGAVGNPSGSSWTSVGPSFNSSLDGPPSLDSLF